MYNKNLLKIEIKSYGDEATGSQAKEIPKTGSD